MGEGQIAVIATIGHRGRIQIRVVDGTQLDTSAGHLLRRKFSGARAAQQWAVRNGLTTLAAELNAVLNPSAEYQPGANRYDILPIRHLSALAA